MAYRLSIPCIKQFVKAQLLADYQRNSLSMLYQQSVDENYKMTVIEFKPGKALLNDDLDDDVLKHITLSVLKSKSCILKTTVSDLDTRLNLERQIAQEIIDQYRDKFRAGCKNDISQLEKSFGLK